MAEVAVRPRMVAAIMPSRARRVDLEDATEKFFPYMGQGLLTLDLWRSLLASLGRR
jgi:hypothetical protein